jgi:outer membrane biosynthesis protein TonB
LPGGFNEETAKAVRQWKYKPAEKDGVKVKVWKQITIAYKRR